MISRVLILLSFLVVTINLVAATEISKRNMNIVQYRTIESYMNESVDPCIDFHQYACGNWETLYLNTTFSDTFDFIDHYIDEKYGYIFKTREITAKRQKRFVRQVLFYYKSCRSLEEFDISDYVEWMQDNEKTIRWPDIELNNDSIEYDWLHMLATLRKYGLNGVLLSQSVLQQRDDSRHFLIDVDRPAEADEFEPLKKWQFDLIMEYLGVRKYYNRHFWRLFTRFELKIMNLYEIEDDIGSQEVKLTHIHIPELTRYLKIIFDVKHFDREMLISITNRPYIKTLFELLKGYDKEFICRYLMVRFLWYLNYNGPTRFDKPACISNVRQQIPMAMDWLYEEYNPTILNETKHIKRIFESIRTHFLKKLTRNPNNFSNEVLEFLSRKLKIMQLKVGNLPRNATIETLEKFYSDLSLNESDFYGNHLRLLRFNTQKQNDQLNTELPLNADEFYCLENTNELHTSTPYYLPRSNLVIVPITMLHLPLYHPELHDIFKYSLLGFLLGHEITHGFDDSGLDYDQNGNMQEISESIKENRKFDKNFDCLYAKNPKVIDEKIADVSGLRWAYETYFSNASEQAILSWSKLPQAQLFFRNFAVFFCTSQSNDELLADSSHGSYRSRLHDTISQFPKFAQIYGCPVGSPMNPTRKCQLWR